MGIDSYRQSGVTPNKQQETGEEAESPIEEAS